MYNGAGGACSLLDLMISEVLSNHNDSMVLPETTLPAAGERVVGTLLVGAALGQPRGSRSRRVPLSVCAHTCRVHAYVRTCTRVSAV